MRDVDKQPETTADAIKRGGDGQRQGDDAQGNMIPATKGGSTKSDGKRGDSEIKLKWVSKVTQRLMDGLARKELRPWAEQLAGARSDTLVDENERKEENFAAALPKRQRAEEPPAVFVGATVFFSVSATQLWITH